jgi:cyclophilin family peptidyl-prolyl cis-trans isomerase
MKAYRKIRYTLLSGLCALLAAGAGAADTPTNAGLPPKPGVADLLKTATPQDWRALDPDNTLYMELPQGRVVIELAPAFAPNHVRNIKALVRAHYFDGLAVLRVQDNFVVQWGDPDDDKPSARPMRGAQKTLKAEFTAPLERIERTARFAPMPEHDGYAPQVGHVDGFPAGRDPKTGQAWLAHCYGMVGVGRDNDADSGGGSALYAAIGPARHLDRNMTVVGRVVAGMPLLSSLPRGPAPMGFYDKPELNLPIATVKIAADVPDAQRSHLEVLRTERPLYDAIVESQRNRGGPFTKVAAGYVDLCATPVPVREQKPGAGL